MSEQTITGKGGMQPVRRPQAEIAGAHNALPHDDHVRGRQGNSAATKTGWRLFSEDVRRGRFFALVGLAFIAAAAVSFATSPEYIVTTVTVQGSK
ncbi:MAG: hypothetical protein M3441_19630, partial [Chloroflexota bacterium]|nr:hypothetical protein [Chloroflexota bacterium]